MPLLLPLLPVRPLPALPVLTRDARDQDRLLQPEQTPVAGPASLNERYCQGTDKEDKATGHKAKSPVTPRTKGDMTMRVVTEIAPGIHLAPGIRVFHPRHQETLVNETRLTLQGPVELKPAQSPAHPNPHSKRGSLSTNPGPLSMKP
ncbi:hypothetical protein MC885_008629 [Smutsia gigantea]|nr:hypothetical protein MC885_008629 [Smutsia gigantea]